MNFTMTKRVLLLTMGLLVAPVATIISIQDESQQATSITLTLPGWEKCKQLLKNNWKPMLVGAAISGVLAFEFIRRLENENSILSALFDKAIDERNGATERIGELEEYIVRVCERPLPSCLANYIR